MFNKVRAAKRVDRIDCPRLVHDHLLCAYRETRRLLGRQRQRLVHRVGMQRLRTAEHGSQRLDRNAQQIDFRLHIGQRDASRLRVETHPPGSRTLRAKRLPHLTRPDPSRRAELGNLLEEIVVRVEKERESRRKLVDMQPALLRPADVLQPVGEGERELLRRRRPGLTDVISGDRNRVPSRHVLRREFDGVGHQAH